MSPQSPQSSQGGNAPCLLRITINDPGILQRCYMPFLRHGGLFVPSQRRFSLHQQVFLILSLPGIAEARGLLTTVAWLTPAEAQNGRPMGPGLAFGEPDQDICRQIETVLTPQAHDTASS